MNPELLLAHLKRLTATLSTQQLVTLAAAFIGVVGVVVGSAYWMSAPTYALLFSDLDAESAASVVTRLKTSKVPYVLDEGGRTIRVAAERVDEMRLELASQGLPATGRIGFEIFDRTAFGTTEFLEHVNYRRALEGELARTIGTISEVASARVHIAMAKDSLFTADQQAAKASVVLKLRTNKPLAAATVTGITRLVASSVESLRPESVVILDTFGRPLSKRPDDADDPGSGLHLDKQRRVENELGAKVTALLEPVIGAGHVRVNISARLNGDSQEETEERWDPTTVVRSKQTSIDSGGALVAAGVAGARSNTPPNLTTSPTTPAAGGTPVTANRSVETTNFEVSKLTRHRIVPSDQLARLSVAVILDDEHLATKRADGTTQVTAKALTPANLQRIQKLVASAVGFDAARGDEVTVDNISFADDSTEEAAPVPRWWQRMAPQLMPVARLLAVVGIAALAFFMLLRPIARRALELPAGVTVVGNLPEAPPVKTVADLEAEMEADLDAVTTNEVRRLPMLTRRLGKTAAEHPDHVARLVRSLLSEAEP